MQSVVEIAPGESREIIILLGEGDTRKKGRELIARYLETATVGEAIERVVNYWDETLSGVEVRTPDAAMDLMLNRWLLYQTLACRVWARSAFYQSGGAYGFRDQLQDVMALVYAKPESTRDRFRAPPRISLRKATSNIGGIRRRVVASARASLTICLAAIRNDLLHPRDRRRIDPRRNDSVSRSLCFSRERGRFVPASSMFQTRKPPFMSTACARLTVVWRQAPTACR